MTRAIAGSVLVVAVLLAACDDAPIGPVPPTADAQLSAAPQVPPGRQCPPHHDYLVNTESSLRAAVTVAKPGSVIAIQGVIQVVQDLAITTPGIVLTCAAPGAGLEAAGANPGDLVTTLVTITASDVHVTHLALDGHAAVATVVAFGDAALPAVRDVIVEDNSLVCGTGALCIEFAERIQGGRIVRNTIEGVGIGYAIWVTGSPLTTLEGTRIEDNGMTALAPAATALAGIRLVRAEGLVVRGNRIEGPWRNGISATVVSRSRISDNLIEGPSLSGVITLSSFVPGDGLNESLIAHNHIHGASQVGIGLAVGCGNQWVLNDVSGNGLGMVLNPRTGNNRVLTADPSHVSDFGAFDCNADGTVDPNVVVVAQKPGS